MSRDEQRDVPPSAIRDDVTAGDGPTGTEFRACGVDVALALIYQPTGSATFRLSIKGLNPIESITGVRRAIEAIPGKSVPLGRPPGSGTYSDSDEFLGAAEKAVAHLRRQQVRVTQATVARELHLDVSTFRRTLRRLGCEWNRLRNAFPITAT